MKILSLSNCLLDHASGSGRTRLAWADGLRQLGHEVTTLASVDLLGGREGKPLGRRWRIAWGALQRLRHEDLTAFDVIEFYGAEFWLATWWLAARRKRPLLVAHTDGLEMLAAERLRSVGTKVETSLRALAYRIKDRLELLAFSKADGFVTASGADGQYLQQHAIRQSATVEVVPLGLEAEYLDVPWQRQTARENRVVFVGSWIDRKGIKTLTTVMTELLRKRPELQFDLYGADLTEVDPLRDFPTDIHEQITVHPRLSIAAMIADLKVAKVFFFPSEYEGFGLALAEAMACGCAAVTTPTGFGADLHDGEEALICPFGDVRIMREAIGRLLDDEALREQIAEAGRQRVQTLRWQRSVKQLEMIYLRWVDELGHPSVTSQASPRKPVVHHFHP